jgi:hypothetical protein
VPLLTGPDDGDWLGCAVALALGGADVVVLAVGWGEGAEQATNSISIGTAIGNSLRIVTSTSIVRGCRCLVKTMPLGQISKTATPEKRLVVTNVKIGGRCTKTQPETAWGE